jgi:peptidoglycan hydrolase-like protein with peptidoglycan-binding domain
MDGGNDVEPARKNIMKKFAVALLATAALSMPAVAQQPAQNTNEAQLQNSGQTAQNSGGQPLSPDKLSRDKVRQVQQALDKSGFNAGAADGRWGPETSNALKQFQQKKNIQANGQLDQQTLSGLGLNGAQFVQQNKGNVEQQH